MNTVTAVLSIDVDIKKVSKELADTALAELKNKFPAMTWEYKQNEKIADMLTFCGCANGVGTYQPGITWGSPENCYPDDWDIDYDVWVDDVEEFFIDVLSKKYNWLLFERLAWDEDFEYEYDEAFEVYIDSYMDMVDRKIDELKDEGV